MALSEQLKDKLRLEIVRVLKAARKGKGVKPKYLTAYQILQRIEDDLRRDVIKAQKTPKVGEHAGEYNTAASDVGKIAGFIKGVVADVHADTAGMAFDFGPKTRVRAGNKVTRLYRWGP